MTENPSEADRRDDLAFYDRACKLARVCSIIAVAGIVISVILAPLRLFLQMPWSGPFPVEYPLMEFPVRSLVALVREFVSREVSGWLLLLIAAMALRLLAGLVAAHRRPGWVPSSDDAFVRRASLWPLVAMAFAAVYILVDFIYMAGYALMPRPGASARDVVASITFSLSGLAGVLQAGMTLIVAAFAVLALLRISRKRPSSAGDTEAADGD